MLCLFQVYSKVIQFYKYICPFFRGTFLIVFLPFLKASVPSISVK